MPRPELHQKLAAAAKSPGVSSPKLACTIAILIFGPRSVAETLAKDLSRYHLFLQHPDPRPSHVVYENPQYLSMVGSSFLNGALLPPILTEAFQGETDRPEEFDQDEEVDLVAVMDNLPEHDYLREADVDGRIRATLKRWVLSLFDGARETLIILRSHQREAVDFVMCREAIGDTKPRRLWRLESFNSGPPV